MTEEQQPPVYYVVFFVTKYQSFTEVMEKEPELIRNHRLRSKKFHEEGKLLLAGAFLDRPEEPLSTMVVLSSREAAEEYAKGDPFLVQGMIRNWSIREWANMFAE
jgi:uncharacterized protein YciI